MGDRALVCLHPVTPVLEALDQLVSSEEPAAAELKCQRVLSVAPCSPQTALLVFPDRFMYDEKKTDWSCELAGGCSVG